MGADAVIVDTIISDVLAAEGGYVDHPADRGGCTHYGITVATLAAWRQRPVTCADVAALTIDEARAIYRQRYITDPGLHQIRDQRLQALLVDFGVHSGTQRAIKTLQRLLGVAADGVIGPQTLAAIDHVGAPVVGRLLLQARGEFLADLLQRDATQRVFAAGWLRRLLRFI